MVNPTPGSSGYRCNNVPLREKPGYESTADSMLNLYWNQARNTYMLTVGVPFNALSLTTGLPQLSTCAAFADRVIPAPTDKTGAKLGYALQPTLTAHAGGPYVLHQSASGTTPRSTHLTDHAPDSARASCAPNSPPTAKTLSRHRPTRPRSMPTPRSPLATPADSKPLPA